MYTDRDRKQNVGTILAKVRSSESVTPDDGLQMAKEEVSSMNANDSMRVREIMEEDSVTFVSVTPFRMLPAPIRSTEEFIPGVCSRESPVSFEIYGDGGSVMYGVRGLDIENLRGQLEGRYPQAVLGVPPEDPLVVQEGEFVSTTVLKVAGADVMPLQVFDDAAITSDDTDPLMSVVGAMSGLPAGVRVLVRTLARAKPGYWTADHRRLGITGSGGANEETRVQEVEQQRTQQASTGGTTPKTGLKLIILLACLVVAGVIAMATVGLPVSAEEIVIFAFVVAIVTVFLFVILIMGKYILQSVVELYFTKEHAFYDPALVNVRVSDRTYDVELQITAYSRGSLAEARREAGTIRRCYERYDRDPESRLVRYTEFSHVPQALEFTSRRRLFGLRRDKRQSIAVLREVAGLWHLPGTNINPAGVRKKRSTRLPLHSDLTAQGAPLGVTTSGRRRLVRLPKNLLTGHTFFAANSGQGKSTAIQHIIRHAMQRKAEGEYSGSIVVVDPHSLLIRSLLLQVPREIAHKVRLLDLGDRSYLPGINLLSPRTSPDREIAAECLAKVVASEWPDHWGARMDSLLRNPVRTLYEANRHPSLRPEDAYTLLDLVELLEDDAFRREVLEKVRPEPLLRWWRNTFPGLIRGNAQSREALVNRLSEYATSPVSAVVFGQSVSTVDLRQSVEDGDIILVDTAAAKVGEKISFLMGSFVIMAIDKIVREREEDSVKEEDHTMVVVDEMQKFKGLPFDEMLSEWRKFGASLTLATQTLESLRATSKTLEQSVLTNVGMLGVFNVSGDDAEDLALELGRDLVTPEDITSLPVHNSYVRLRGSGLDIDPFSVEFLPPGSADRAVAGAIRRRSARYAQNVETAEARLGL